MKTSRYSEQQNAFILKQAEDGTTVEEVVPEGGYLSSDLLPMAEQIWRLDAVTPARSGRDGAILTYETSRVSHEPSLQPTPTSTRLMPRPDGITSIFTGTRSFSSSTWLITPTRRPLA